MADKFNYAKRPVSEDAFRWLVGLFMIIGIITAALNLTFGGFAPIYWFLLAFLFLLVVICHEAYRIATILENKK